jgi:hypothetical protein
MRLHSKAVVGGASSWAAPPVGKGVGEEEFWLGFMSSDDKIERVSSRG